MAQYLSANDATLGKEHKYINIITFLRFGMKLVEEFREILKGTKPLTLFNFLRAVNTYEGLSSGSGDNPICM